MPFQVSGELQKFVRAQGRGAGLASQLAGSKQSGDDSGRGRAEAEALRHFVPAIKRNAWRLPADRSERGPHGPDDQMSFTAPDLARASARDLHIDARWPYCGGGGVVQGQR
jgi:hypothetical protein